MNKAEPLYLQLLANPLVKCLLLPASLIYGVGSYIRVKAYADGIVSRTTPSVPVISIGNLTVGGTGKTPVTIDIAERLMGDGLRLAILSRGYKRISKDSHTVVSDGNNLLASPLEAGDEPYMMAQALPGCTIISGKARSKTAGIAIENYHCDAIVLDDGFQHLKLKRNYDVVLLDYNVDLSGQSLLPLGLLREPKSALGRATHVVISKVPQDFDAIKLERITRLVETYAPRAQISMCRFNPAYLKGVHGPLSLNTIKGKRIIAMCGIARPKSFIDSLKETGGQLADCRFFPDHYWFSREDLADLKRALEANEADYIITTEKDLVRMPWRSQPECSEPGFSQPGCSQPWLFLAPGELADLESKVLALVLETEWIGEPPRFQLSTKKKVLEVGIHA